MDFWRCYSFDYPHVEGKLVDDNSKLLILCKGLENKGNVAVTLSLIKQEPSTEVKKQESPRREIKLDESVDKEKSQGSQSETAAPIPEIKETYTGLYNVDDEYTDIEVTGTIKLSESMHPTFTC